MLTIGIFLLSNEIPIVRLKKTNKLIREGQNVAKQNRARASGQLGPGK